MAQKIIIEWKGYVTVHEIIVSDSFRKGYCITHKCVVSENSRCREFPTQTAVWSDLWRIAIGKSK